MQPSDLSLAQQVTHLNRISAFLAQCDIGELSRSAVQTRVGQPQVDLLLLLGNSLVSVAEKAAHAYQHGLAKEIMIAGGVGHSTQYLEEAIRRHPRYRTILVDGRAEADILKDLMTQFYNIDASAIILENESTNCGENAWAVQRVLQKVNKTPRTILLLQDPTMQRRTDASFQRVWGTDTDVSFVNYATFVPEVVEKNGQLAFLEPNLAAWDMDRFLSLVMGEIPRLRDDENGYGPRGKGFIAHVEIPQDVLSAYEKLLPHYHRYQRMRDQAK